MTEQGAGIGRSAANVASVAVIITAFEPPADLADAVEQYLRQADLVVVVDDGSPSGASAVLKRCAAAGASVLRQETNSGIAAALNAGIALARQKRPALDFIMTVDQDSRIADNYLDDLVRTFRAAEASGLRVGMVSPKQVSGLASAQTGTHKGFLLGGEPIQSGLLIPVPVFDQVGRFLEEFFIDGVDSEFYLRCRRAGLRNVLSPEAFLEHSLGTMVQAKLLGRTLSWRGQPVLVRTAAVWRYYYIFRNRLLILRIHRVPALLWFLGGLLKDIRHLVLVSFLASAKRDRLAASLSGLRDGLRGRSGKRPA